MKKLVAVFILVLGVSCSVWAQGPTRWVHVKVVERGNDAETVRINLPLSLAEKVLASGQMGKLKEGKLQIRQANVKGLDFRQLLEAVRTAPDNEFVTVESAKENVRVAKAGGCLLVKVRSGADKGEAVDIKVPFTMIDAMLSSPDGELDLAAGIRVLSAYDNLELVSVNDHSSTVRIWTDTRSAAE
jgi:hypothetical protein